MNERISDIRNKVIGVALRVAGYIRVSSLDQVDGFSLDAQRRAIETLCEQEGWNLVEIYVDEGKSARRDSATKRPAFSRMLEDATQDRLDLVVTHTLDRLSRNILMTMQTFKILSDNKVRYRAIAQDIDYSTPEGYLHMVIIGAFAQYFSDILSMHVKKGIQEKVRSGRHHGNPAFGYERCTADCIEKDEDHMGFHILPREGEAVRQMFARYAAGGESGRTLAEWLTSQGFLTNVNRPVDLFGELVEVHGREFTSYAVYGILKNPFYKGVVRYRDEVYPGLHKAIVDEDTFQRVQDTLAKNYSRSVSINKVGKNAYLLANLIRCSECGMKLHCETKPDRRATRTYVIVYYRSPIAQHSGACKFAGKRIRAESVDGQVCLLLEGFTLRSDWLQWILDTQIRSSDVSEAQARKRELEQELQLVREMTRRRLYDLDQGQKMIRDLELQLSGISIPQVDAVEEAGKLLENFGEYWKTLGLKERHAILTTMLDAVYVDLENNELVGLAPKSSFIPAFLAMTERKEVNVYDGRNASG